MEINPELIALAEWRLDQIGKQASSKVAYVPPGGDPSQQGADPSQGAASPPGMDPSQAGGAPPADPNAGAPVPGGGGLTPDSIAQIVSQTMQQQGGMGGAPGAGGAPGQAGKPVKASLETVAMDIFQVKAMLQFLFKSMDIDLPPNILDGPNRNPQTGEPMPPGAPGSTSDPATQQALQAQQPQPGGAQGAVPGGQGGAIPPIQPMQAGGPGAGEKTSSDGSLYMGDHYPKAFDPRIVSKASALSAIIQRLGKR